MSKTLVPPFRLLKFPKPIAPAPTVLQAAIEKLRALARIDLDAYLYLAELAKLLFEMWQEPQPR